MQQLNLEDRNIVTGRDLEAAVRGGVTEVVIRTGTVLTSTARDIVRSCGVTVKETGTPRKRKVAAPAGGGFAGVGSAERIFRSAEALEIKKEIVDVGRKLWQRQYVDGNGGNISCRISGEYVLCTPTLTSKADLKVEDICMVDLKGTQVAGAKRITSEIKIHLTAYNNQPKAVACVHAHPPHATAYAVVGKVPPTGVISEAEVFVGRLGLAPYDTPGSPEVAEKLRPLLEDHNAILMANHGLLAWADTVTHAEWLVEVVDTYCQTLILAAQLGAPLQRMTAEQGQEIMEIKKTLDLPDPRISGKECMLCDMPDYKGITVDPSPATGGGGTDPGEIESVIRELTDKVMAALDKE
jgi:L-fuculose-phosphate aldolase